MAGGPHFRPQDAQAFTGHEGKVAVLTNTVASPYSYRQRRYAPSSAFLLPFG